MTSKVFSIIKMMQNLSRITVFGIVHFFFYITKNLIVYLNSCSRQSYNRTIFICMYKETIIYSLQNSRCIGISIKHLIRSRKGGELLQGYIWKDRSIIVLIHQFASMHQYSLTITTREYSSL